MIPGLKMAMDVPDLDEAWARCGQARAAEPGINNAAAGEWDRRRVTRMPLELLRSSRHPMPDCLLIMAP